MQPDNWYGNFAEAVMAGAIESGQLSEREFDALIRALSSTVKGRAFLREHSERSRPEETRNLLEAVRQVEANLSVVRENLLPAKLAEDLKRIAADFENAPDNHDQREQAISDLRGIADDLMRIETKTD